MTKVRARVNYLKLAHSNLILFQMVDSALDDEIGRIIKRSIDILNEMKCHNHLEVMRSGN